MGENKEVRDVFLAALAQDSAEERNGYLDQACRGKPELRKRVEQLLGEHQQAGSFLEEPALRSAQTAVLTAPVTEKPGDRIGPCKPLQQNGKGGRGVAQKRDSARKKKGPYGKPN